MVGALIGLIFVAICLLAVARLTETVLLTQRLDALAADSVRRITVASGVANPNAENEAELRIENALPNYRDDLSFSLMQTSNLVTFQIHLSNYSVAIWPGIGTGTYTLSVGATAREES